MEDKSDFNLDWALWFQWIMATTLGWLLGRFLLPNLAPVTIGIALGIFQWFVLQYRIRNAWHWILATSIGWSIGAFIIVSVTFPAQDFMAGMLAGLGTGISQWLILRSFVNWSLWWIVMNIVAWTTGMALLPGLLLTGVVVGVITGIALILLLHFPKAQLGLEKTFR